MSAILESFLGFFLAFLAKDAYDVLARPHIVEWLHHMKQETKGVVQIPRKDLKRIFSERRRKE